MACALNGWLTQSQPVAMFFLEKLVAYFCNTTFFRIKYVFQVFKNYMCDVKVSNNKLYHRAIGIIQVP